MSPSTTAASRDDRLPSDDASRRRFLAGVATVGTASLAGCAAIADWVAGQILEEVNVFNETQGQVEGSIEIQRPDGDVALSESFTLEAQSNDDDDEEPEEDALATYADVWGDAGEYEVSVDLEEDSAIDGETSATETVPIENPEEEMLAVVFGAEDLDPIHVTVGESLTDFQ